jgi:hypothetical protein
MVKDFLKKRSIFWAGEPRFPRTPPFIQIRKCGFYKKYKIIKGNAVAIKSIK